MQLHLTQASPESLNFKLHSQRENSNSEISVTHGLDLGLDMLRSSGLGLENCLNTSNISLDHQECPIFGLEAETDHSEPQKLRLAFKSLGLCLEN